MALLNIFQIRDSVETDLNDVPLQRLLDDAEAEIIRFFGAHTSQVDYIDGGDEHLFPSRLISSVTQVIESINDTDTTLSADDYELRHGGRSLRRLNDGTNGRSTWGERIKLAYTPVDDTDARKRVQADLCQLAIQYNATKAEKAGNWSASYPEYEAEREKILMRLAPRHRLML